MNTISSSSLSFGRAYIDIDWAVLRKRTGRYLEEGFPLKPRTKKLTKVTQLLTKKIKKG